MRMTIPFLGGRAIAALVAAVFACLPAMSSAWADNADVEPNSILIDDAIKPRIVGGVPAADREWPWQVLIIYNNSGTCGGSIISPRWILTAAHCVVNDKGQLQNAARFVVYSGATTNPVKNGHKSGVRRVVYHEGYTSDKNRGAMFDDIALLELTNDAVGQSVRLADAKADQESTRASSLLTVTGWGTTSEGGELSGRLMEVSLPAVDMDTCARVYQGKTSSKQICAGRPQGGQDSCQGDSGGPLVAEAPRGGQRLSGGAKEYVQVGVVSWGAGCGRPNFPGVYTRVASYRSWIDSWLDTRKPDQTSSSLATNGSSVTPEAPRLKVDMAPGNKPKLKDVITVSVTSNVAGHVMMVDVDPSGALNELLPNQFTPDNPYARISAGQTLTIPPAGAGFQFRVTGATGRGTLAAILVSSPEYFQSLKTSGRLSVEKSETSTGKGNEILAGWEKILGSGKAIWAIGRQDYEVLP